MYTSINTSFQKQKLEGIIINSLNNWTIHSKSKKFPAMFALVLPNSAFHDLSFACQKSHESGIQYFYEFEGLEIVSLSKNKTKANVKGSIKLIMEEADITYTGKFLSTCSKEEFSSYWKLNDIEIEWE